VQGRIAAWAKALADEKAARESRQPNHGKVQANATLRVGDPDPRVVESASFRRGGQPGRSQGAGSFYVGPDFPFVIERPLNVSYGSG
jgi:hypothetical protein